MAALEFGNPAGRLSTLWLHANGFNAMTYQSILAPLGLRTKVQAVDLRGHGRSSLPAKPGKLKSWHLLRDDVIAFIEKESPTRPIVLAGHSMGATIALLVAGKRPDKVAGLVLVDPVIFPPAFYRNRHILPFIPGLMRPPSIIKGTRRRRREFSSPEEIRTHYKSKDTFKSWRDPFLEDYILDGFDRLDDNSPDSEDQTWRILCDPKYEAAAFGAQRNRPWGALAKVKKHKLPITILRPERRSVLSDKVADRLVRKCPHMVLKVRTNTSHFLPMEAPYDVRDQISEYIARLIEGFGEGEDGAVKRSLRG